MENKLKNAVCRLCLNSCDFTFETVEATEIVRILGLQMDLNTNGKPELCQTCSENLQKCFDFKTVCLYTEDCIKFFKDGGIDIKLNLREIYLRKNESENCIVPEYDTICRLCMEVVESDCYIALNDETKDVTSARIILGRCFSELNLGITKDPVICIPCNGSLHSYFEFIKQYLNIENKIKEYEIEKTEEITCKPQVKLQFGENNVPGYKYTVIKTGESYCKSEFCDEIKLKLENPVQEEIQEVRIKHELDCTEAERLNGDISILYGNNEYIDTSIVKKCYEYEQDSDAEIKSETCEEAESREGFNVKHEEIDLKTEDGNTIRFGDNMLGARETLGVVIYQCEICKFITKCKQSLKEHLIIHSEVSGVVIRQCEENKIKFECSLDEHIPTHRNDSDLSMYQCAICVFEAKQKAAFRQHMLIHKNASEVATYQCDICTFETRYRHVLKLHTLTHKDTSEVTTYSCGLCEYKAKRKGHLKQHMLSHKNTSEVTTYSCRVCTYEAKRKGNLVQHMMTHNNSLEVAMYQCDVCTFSTRHKNVLKRHMLVHKNSSELPTFSCGICSYKAKQRGNLNRHMLVHKNESEVITYQCDVCAFRTRHKNVLRRHMLIHTRA